MITLTNAKGSVGANFVDPYNSAFPDLSQFVHSTSVMQDMVVPAAESLLSTVFKFDNTNLSGIKT